MEVLADARMVNRLAAAAGPNDLNAIYRCGGTQAEMKRRRVLRQVRSLAADTLHVDDPTDENAHHRPDSLAIALPALETDLNPIASLGAIGPQQNERAAVAGNCQVDVAVIVEIGGGQSARVQQPVNVGRDARQNILVLRTVVVKQERLLRDQQLMVARVFQSVPIDDN